MHQTVKATKEHSFHVVKQKKMSTTYSKSRRTHEKKKEKWSFLLAPYLGRGGKWKLKNKKINNQCPWKCDKYFKIYILLYIYFAFWDLIESKGFNPWLPPYFCLAPKNNLWKSIIFKKLIPKMFYISIHADLLLIFFCLCFMIYYHDLFYYELKYIHEN